MKGAIPGGVPRLASLLCRVRRAHLDVHHFEAEASSTMVRDPNGRLLIGMMKRSGRADPAPRHGRTPGDVQPS